MIAAVQVDSSPKPCAVYWTGRKGLSVKIRTWCGGTHDASDGVIQIPDGAKICDRCQSYIKAGRPNL